MIPLLLAVLALTGPPPPMVADDPGFPMCRVGSIWYTESPQRGIWYCEYPGYPKFLG